MRTATATCAASTEPGPSTGNSLSTTRSLPSPFMISVRSDERALAVAAIVIEELDQRDVALRIADRHLARRVEQRLGMVLDRGLGLFGLGELLALVELGHHLLQHLRMGEQVVPDDRARSRRVAARRKLCALSAPAASAGRPWRRRRAGDGVIIIGFFLCGGVVFRELIGAMPALGGLKLAMSSALTQPGEPTGKRVLARVASWRAVL